MLKRSGYIQRKTPLRRGKPPRKRSESPEAVAKRKADAVFQEEVCRGGACAVCGHGPVSGHHLVPKVECVGRLAHLRHDTLNGIPLCLHHHVPFAHEQPTLFKAWLKEKRPEIAMWIDGMRSISCVAE